MSACSPLENVVLQNTVSLHCLKPIRRLPKLCMLRHVCRLKRGDVACRGCRIRPRRPSARRPRGMPPRPRPGPAVQRPLAARQNGAVRRTPLRQRSPRLQPPPLQQPSPVATQKAVASRVIQSHQSLAVLPASQCTLPHKVGIEALYSDACAYSSWTECRRAG